MKNTKLLGTLLLCAGVGLLVGVIVLHGFTAWSESRHIGIIGGADAPTAIYLMQRGVFLPECIGLAAGLALVITGILLRRIK